MTQEKPDHKVGDFISAEIMGEVVGRKYKSKEWWYVIEFGNQRVEVREDETKG